MVNLHFLNLGYLGYLQDCNWVLLWLIAANQGVAFDYFLTFVLHDL